MAQKLKTTNFSLGAVVGFGGKPHKKSVPTKVVVKTAVRRSSPLGMAVAGSNKDGSPRYVYGPPAPLKHRPGTPVVFPRNPVATPAQVRAQITPGRASAADAAGLIPSSTNVSGLPPTAYPGVSGQTVGDIIDQVSVEQKVADARQKEKARRIKNHEPGWLESGFLQVMGDLIGAGPLALDAGKQLYDIGVASSPVINATNPGYAKARLNSWTKRATDYAVGGAEFYKDAANAIIHGDTKWLKENYVNLGLQAAGAVGTVESAMGNLGRVASAASRARLLSKLKAEEEAATAANDFAGAHSAREAAKAVNKVYTYGSKAAGEGATQLAHELMSGWDKAANKMGQWVRNDTRPGSPRLRPDKKVSLPPRTAATDQPLPTVDSIIIPSHKQRLRSGGVLRRAVQKRVTEPIGRALDSPLNTGTIKVPFRDSEIPLPFSYQRSWNRVTKKIANDIAYTTREAADKAASDVVKNMMDPTLRKIKPGSAPDIAAWFRIKGVDPAQAARVWEDHLAQLDNAGVRIEPAKRHAIQESIDKAKSVDPRLMSDVPPAPHEMSTDFAKQWQQTQTLSRIGHDVSQNAGRAAVESGILTEGQQQLGSTVGPRVMAGERVLKDAVSNLVRQERAARDAAAEAMASGNRGRAAYYLDHARNLNRQRVGLTERTLYGIHEGYTRAADAVEQARAAVRSARGTVERDRAVVALHNAKRNLARERTRARRVTWTQENYDPATAPKSAYIEDYSGIQNGSRRPRWMRNGTGPAFAPSAQKRTSGHLLRTGETFVGNTRATVAGSAESLARQHQVALGAQNFLSELAATRTVNGEKKIITGQAAVDLTNASQGMYTAVDRRMLDRVYAIKNTTLEGQKVSDLHSALLAGDIKDKIAIPTAAYEAWREVMGSKRNGLDAFNQVFKSTVLPFKMGWYFQNFIGNWLQFFLQAGPDMQALRVGNTKEAQALMPDRMRVGLVGESAPNVATRGGNPSAHGASAVLGRFFGFNDRIEKWSKSASYMAAAKGAVRKDPLIGKSGRMSDAQLVESLKGVADAAGRNEPWAVALVNDAARTSQDFLGDYSRYTHFERKYMRRVLPFYAWARTITRLALMLPVKYPKRTALLALGLDIAGKLGSSQDINDLFGMPAVKLFNRIIPTSGLIPSDTLLGEFGALKNAATQSSNPLDFVAHTATEAGAYAFQNASPYLQFGPVVALGATPIGIPLQFSPGYGDIVTTTTGRRLRIDPATGSAEEVTPRYGFSGISSFFENQFPPAKMATQLIAGSRRPYANVAPHDVISWALRGRDPNEAKQLFAPPPRTGRPLSRDWITTVSGFGLDAPAYIPDWNAAYKRWRLTQRSARQGEAKQIRDYKRSGG